MKNKGKVTASDVRLAGDDWHGLGRYRYEGDDDDDDDYDGYEYDEYEYDHYDYDDYDYYLPQVKDFSKVIFDPRLRLVCFPLAT